MYTIFAVFVLGTIAYYVLYFYYCRRALDYWKNKKVNGPKPIPFFGNLKESVLRKKHVGIIYKEIYDKYPEEKMVGIYRMTSPALIIRDLDLVKQILIKDFEMFPDRGMEFSKQGLGDNLFHADSNAWKALRNRVTPFFSSGKLKNMMPLLTDKGDKFVDYLESICPKHPEQEVHSLFQKYAIATIMAFSFGLDVDTIKDKTGLLEQIDKSMFKTTYAAELDMLFPGILKKMNKSLYSDMVNNFCYEVVQTVFRLRDGKPSGRNDVLDVLLELNLKNESNNDDKFESFKFTEHVMAGQVFIFFAAGNANNSNIFSFSMYHLAKNPDVQTKVIAEIDEVLKRYNGELTYDALREMTYLDCVFDETLRKHPTTNSLQRAAAKDYTIPDTDVTIEKGTSVVISQIAIHNDEKNYPNPQKFDPDRFTPENIGNRHSCAYLPFGAGPRTCLGTRFGRMQYKVCVVKVLSKFRVEPSRRTKDFYKINPMRTLLCADGGIYLNIIPRSKQT